MARDPNLERLIATLSAPPAAPQKPQGVGIADYAKQALGGAVQAAGYGLRGLAEPIAAPVRSGEINARDALINADPLIKLGDRIAGAGDAIQGTVSDAAKQRMADSNPTGELLHPSSWSLGEHPSVAGYALNAASVLGQIAPIAATGLATHGQVAPTAAVAAGLGGGAAGQQEEQRIAQMTPQELAQVPLYQQLIAQGLSPADAQAAAAARAGSKAALTTMPVSALSAFTEGLPVAGVGQKALSKLVGTSRLARATTGALIDAVGEGAQEATEQVAQTYGANQATGENRSLGTDTFQNAVLGAIGALPLGAVGAAHDVEHDPAAAPAPAAQSAPVQAAPPAESAAAPEAAPTPVVQQPAFTPRQHPVTGAVEVAPGVVVHEADGTLSKALVEGARQGALDRPAVTTLDNGTTLATDTGEVLHQAELPMGTAASVPFMITAAQRRELTARGYDRQSIAKMRPDEAQAILAQPAAPESQAPIAPSNDELDAIVSGYYDAFGALDAQTTGRIARRFGISKQAVADAKRRVTQALNPQENAREEVAQGPAEVGASAATDAAEQGNAGQQVGQPDHAGADAAEPARAAADGRGSDSGDAAGTDGEAGRGRVGADAGPLEGAAAADAAEQRRGAGVEQPAEEALSHGQPEATTGERAAGREGGAPDAVPGQRADVSGEPAAQVAEAQPAAAKAPAVAEGGVHDAGAPDGEQAGHGGEVRGQRAGAASADHGSDAGAVAEADAPAVAEPKWFGNQAKADAYLKRKKLADSHEVVQNGQRFEVRPKAEKVVRPMPDRNDPLFEQKNVLRQLQNGLDGTHGPDGRVWTPQARDSVERSVAELQAQIAAAAPKAAPEKNENERLHDAAVYKAHLPGSQAKGVHAAEIAVAKTDDGLFHYAHSHNTGVQGTGASFKSYRGYHSPGYATAEEARAGALDAIEADLPKRATGGTVEAGRIKKIREWIATERAKVPTPPKGGTKPATEAKPDSSTFTRNEAPANATFLYANDKGERVYLDDNGRFVLEEGARVYQKKEVRPTRAPNGGVRYESASVPEARYEEASGNDPANDSRILAWGGQGIRYTGRTEQQDGKTVHEARYTDGPNKGQTVLVPDDTYRGDLFSADKARRGVTGLEAPAWWTDASTAEREKLLQGAKDNLYHPQAKATDDWNAIDWNEQVALTGKYGKAGEPAKSLAAKITPKESTNARVPESSAEQPAAPQQARRSAAAAGEGQAPVADTGTRWDAMDYGQRQALAEQVRGGMRPVIHRLAGSTWAQITSEGERADLEKAMAAKTGPSAPADQLTQLRAELAKEPGGSPRARDLKKDIATLERGEALTATKAETPEVTRLRQLAGALPDKAATVAREQIVKAIDAIHDGRPRDAAAILEDVGFKLNGQYGPFADVAYAVAEALDPAPADEKGAVFEQFPTEAKAKAFAATLEGEPKITSHRDTKLRPTWTVQREAITEKASPSATVATWVQGKLEAGEKFTAPMLAKIANEAFGGTQAEGTYSVKDAYDAMELGVNRWLMAHPEFAPTGDAAAAVKAIGALQAKIDDVLPTQTKRTPEMEEYQQFSTHPGFAFLANWAANLSGHDVVLEPSAGVGGLAAFAKLAGAQVVANELSPRRAAVLKELGLRTFTENAEQLHNVLPDDVKPTAVVMNPPFSSTAGRVQGQRKTINGGKHIEQALARLEPGGRLVAIVGEGMAEGKPAFKAWWDGIKAKYTVRANLGLPGKEYAKYGTTFDNNLLVIDKAGPTTAPVITGKVQTLADAVPLLEAIRDERQGLEGARPAERATGQPDGQAGAVGGPGAGPGGRLAPADAPDLGTGARADGRELSGEGAGSARPGQRAADQGPAAGSVRAADRNARRGGADQSVEPVGADAAAGRGEADAGSGEPGGVVVTARAAGSSQADTGPINANSTFESYQPQRLEIAGAKAHPGKLVQSAAMAAVEPPAVSYTPNLPKAAITEGKLSSAQLEAIVYAGQAHSQLLADGSRRGYFIGDGTGVGKGREIGGIILDNLRQGRKKAVWISEKSGLLDDAKRDFKGVGGDEKALFLQGKTKASEAINAKDGVLFTTYATLRSGETRSRQEGQAKPKSRMDQIVDWLGPDFDGVIAFDEAHNMGNAIAMRGKRGKTDPSSQALAGVELQKRLPKARVVYVSATGATEVANLSYATRLGLWGPGTAFASPEAFINEIHAGGLAAMELVSRDMKQMGAYLARSLSFDGVTYSRIQHDLSDYQRDVYNELAKAWQVVLRNVHEALALTGVTTANSTNARAKEAALSAFWGTQQRFFNQVLTALQMPSVLDQAQKDLAAGHSVVMQLVNTNEAALNRAIASLGEDDSLEDLDLTPRDTLMQYVRNSYPVQQFEEYMDDEGNFLTRPVLDAAGEPVFNKEAIAARDQLLENLAHIRVPDGPLEMIVDTFGADDTAEITGRRNRVVRRRNDQGALERVQERRSASHVKADADAFQAGKKRVLVFSDAGGTGFSFHADLTAKNQQRRMHYLVQPGWRADKAVQGFGRTHRSNEASQPHYYLATTDLPAHKRFISTIARRLDQLGALTKGQRDASSQGLLSAKDNLESPYATDAVESLFRDMYHGRAEGLPFKETTWALGFDKLTDRDGGLNESKIPSVPQFLNRLLSLPTDMQATVFDAFVNRMEAKVQTAINNGTLDTGMETIKALSTKLVSEQPVYTDPASGAQTHYVELELTQPSQFLPFPASGLLDSKYRYVQNKQSGRVWAVKDAGTTTNAQGRIKDRVQLASPTRSRVEDKDAISDEKFTELTTAQARELWAKETAAAPQTYIEKAHLVTGALLPIWDRFRGHARVVRVLTDDGKRYLGRRINEGDLTATLKALGANSSEARMTPEQVQAAVLKDGKALELANGWTLQRAKVNGEDRVEIGRFPHYQYAQQRELERIGGYLEKIQWQQRAFLPTGAKGVEALTQLTARNPVVGPVGGAEASVDFSKTSAGNVAVPASKGIDPATLDAQVGAFMRKLKHPPVVVQVVATAADLPAHVRNAAGFDASVEAAHDNGAVYLVADRLPTAARAEQVLAHEIIGHYGVEQVLGKAGFQQVREQIVRLRDAGKMADLFEEIEQRYGPLPPDTLAAETLAVMAEKGMRNTLLGRVMAATRAFLRKLGLVRTYTEGDLRGLIAQAGRYVKGARATPYVAVRGVSFGQTAYHGTPHTVDKFSLQKIGTGEGAQAYGYGLYFASEKAIAKYYRDTLSADQQEVTLDWHKLTPAPVGSQAHKLVELVTANRYLDHADLTEAGLVPENMGVQAGDEIDLPELLDALSKNMAEVKGGGEVYRLADGSALADNDGTLHAITPPPQGNLYSVEVPDDHDLLDWDKPLSEQPAKVRAALQPFIDSRVSKADQEQFDRMGGKLHKAATIPLRWTGENVYDAIAKQELERAYEGMAQGIRPIDFDRAQNDSRRLASEYLAKIGIPGLRYLDGNSRRAKTEGTHNYVIWDEAAIGAPQVAFSRSPYVNNASGESSASVEAINRLKQEQASGQLRLLIEPNGTVRPLLGVDAVDTFARTGQIIVQRNVGKATWTPISTDAAMSRELVAGKINAARMLLDTTAEEMDGPGEESFAGNAYDLPAVNFSKRPAGDVADELDRAAKFQLTDVVPFLRDKREDWRPGWLGLLTLRQLAEVAGRYLPRIQHYADVVQAMQTRRNGLQEQAAHVANDWWQWQRKNREQGTVLASVMHDATLAGVDPAEAFVPGTVTLSNGEVVPMTMQAVRTRAAELEKQAENAPAVIGDILRGDADRLRQTLAMEAQRREAYPALKARFDALPAEAQALYRTVRDSYAERAEAMQQALIKRITGLELPANERQALADRVRAHFESARVQAPYFPLARFGEYWVAAEKDGQKEFRMMENRAQQRRVQAAYAKDGWTTKAGAKIDMARAIDGASASFMAQVTQTLADNGVDKDVADEVYQLYLRTLPELSVRKQFIHRAGVAGYAEDALRAYAAHMNHGAYQLARLEHTHTMEGLLRGMREDVKALADQGGVEAIKAARAMAEVDKRHEWVMNPKDAAWVQRVSSANFAYYLGATPAAALVNLTQGAFTTFPTLAARYGWGKAMMHLVKGMRQSIRTFGHMEKVLTGDEARAHAELLAMGAIDKTRAHDLAGMGEGSILAYNPAWRNTMTVLSGAFHKAEVFNRESAGLAAYRLAREAGEAHDVAVKYAADTIFDTHFDYSNANRARFMQSNTAKVLLAFRQYSQHMSYYLWRNFYQSIRGATADEKAEARRKLVGTLGMTAVFAGALGLPLMSLAFGMANAFHQMFGDDDEPWDAETEFRNFLVEMLGPTFGKVAATGPVNALTGIDLASRTKLNDMWFRSPDQELEGRAQFDYWLEQAAGPVGGIFGNFARANQLANDGQLWQAWETAMPKALRDVIKSARYATQGVNTLRGDPLVADVSPYQELMQAAGFSPSKVAEQYDANNALKGYEQALLQRRQALMDAYAMAVRMRDTEAMQAASQKIDAFNGKNPEIGITAGQIRRSLLARERYSEEAANGIVLNKHLAAKLHAKVGFAGDGEP